MIKEINISFPGGMDSDSDDSKIANGDYRMLRNMRNGISADGKGGTIENLPNVSQLAIGLLSGATMIGMARDNENDMLYLFYSNNYLIKYDGSSVVYILKGVSALNLSASYLIYNARYLDGKVYFTDNNSQPKVVDVDRALNYTQNFDGRTFRGQYRSTSVYGTGRVVTFGAYYYVAKETNTGVLPTDTSYWIKLSKIADSYAPGLTEEDLYIIVKPPLEVPVYTWITDSSYRGNTIGLRNFQFTYRYIYQDYRKSVFGPASRLQAEGNSGNLWGDIVSEINNDIRVKFHTGPSEVRFIEIAYRSTDDMSTWYRFKIIEKRNDDGRVLLADNIEWFEIFYNNQTKIAISDTEVYKPYHYVPEKAGFLEIIEDNHLVFADVVEGKDAVTPEVTHELSVHDVSSSWYNKFNLIANVIKDYSRHTDGTVYTEAEWNVHLPSFNPMTSTGGSITIQEYSGGGVKTATIGYLASEVYPNNTKNRLRNECISAGMDVEDIVSGQPGAIRFNKKGSYGSVEKEYNDQGYRIVAFVSYTEGDWKIKTLKQGAIHSCGIVYMDGHRRSSAVIGTDQMKVYIPHMLEDTDYGTILPKHFFRIKFKINHKPPSWAKKYIIVYQGSDISTFWIFRALNEVIVKTDQLDLYVDQWHDYNQARKDYNEEPYVFQEGDRIRWLGTADRSANSFIKATDHYDLAVLGVGLDSDATDEDGDPTGKPIVQIEKPEGWTYTGVESVWEIYRPRITDDPVFYETDAVNDISMRLRGLVHEGSIDQTLDNDGNPSTQAEVTVYFGDIYKYKRAFYLGRIDPVAEFMENAYSAVYNKKYKIEDLGLPKVVDEFLSSRRMNNRYRYGGPLQLGTKNNQIADFEYGDFGELSSDYGIINGLENVGFVLKILQSHRVWSIYVKRTSSFNPDGTESLILTDALLGTRRPSSQTWGLQDRGALAVHERYLYFWDRSSGVILRDSANGMFPVSDYKMINYFRKLSFEASAGLRCRIGFNEAYNEVYFCFYESGGTDNKIVVFLEDERQPKWTHEIELECDGIANIGNKLFTFLGNVIDNWFTSSSEFGLLRAEYKNPYFDFVVNIDPEKVKRWRALSYDASHVFYAPNVGDISTPANINYGSGMQTRLLEGSVKGKEGVYYAPIKNDANTPGAATAAEAIVNGRPMRGKTIKIKLSLDASDHQGEYINLENVKVVYSDSEKS